MLDFIVDLSHFYQWWIYRHINDCFNCVVLFYMISFTTSSVFSLCCIGCPPSSPCQTVTLGNLDAFILYYFLYDSFYNCIAYINHYSSFINLKTRQYLWKIMIFKLVSGFLPWTITVVYIMKLFFKDNDVYTPFCNETSYHLCLKICI